MDYSYSIRAQDCIAGGALTNSKRPDCFVRGVYQTHATHGSGPFIYDVSGHKLYDFICGLGSNILGYGNEKIARAIYTQATRGTTLSMSSAIEIQLAEKVKEIVPWVQKVRFLKTGTQATTSAIRIARTFHGVKSDNEGYYGLTGSGDFTKIEALVSRTYDAKDGKKPRALVLSSDYHGDADIFTSLTEPRFGVLKDPYMLQLKGNEDLIPMAAAVIIEPISIDMSEARMAWLRDLRKKCTESGTILIFDEIITGFRTKGFTMSKYFGIEPDLICLGKAMANGMPISCVGGKDEVMNCGDYFVSSTFAGETCSIAAALKTIELLQTKAYDLNDLWNAGAYFTAQFNLMAPESIKINGYATRGVFEGDLLFKALLWQEAYRAGILFGSSFFINFAHISRIDRILNIIRDIVMRIKSGEVTLMGEMPKSPFSQQTRGLR